MKPKSIIKSKVIAVSAILVTTACSISVPVTGKFNNGESLTGVAKGSLSKGAVIIESEKGLKCEGEYDPLSQSLELTIPLNCNNDTTGKAQVTRNSDLMSGKGGFTLNNGRKGNFIFGK